MRSQAAFGANGSVPMAGSGTHDRIGESVLVSELRMRGSNMLSRQKQEQERFHNWTPYLCMDAQPSHN